MNPQFMFETAPSAPLNLTASPAPDQSHHPCGYQPVTSLSTPPHQIHDQSCLLNLLHDQLSKGRNANPISDEEYGFLWEDMNMEETSLVDGMGSNLEEMRFEVDNSMVFL